MKYVLRIVSRANGDLFSASDTFVVDYDPDFAVGVGHVESTHKVENARLFDSFEEAMALYRKVSTVRPTRRDGKPNRPLTAFTVIVERREES